MLNMLQGTRVMTIPAHKSTYRPYKIVVGQRPSHVVPKGYARPTHVHERTQTIHWTYVS